MELHLKIIGFLFIGLSLLHVAFPKYFNWKKEFENTSLINRQMMYVHTFFLALLLLLMGILCVSNAKELIETKLGNRFCFGLFIFWFVRLVVQFFGYSSKLWKGKPRETVIHIVFSVFWTYISVVFFLAYYANRNV